MDSPALQPWRLLRWWGVLLSACLFVFFSPTSVKRRCHWKCQSMLRQHSGRRRTKFHFSEKYLFCVCQGLVRCVVGVSTRGRCLFPCLNIETQSDSGCGWVSGSPSFLSLCLSVSVKGRPPGPALFPLFFFFFCPISLTCSFTCQHTSSQWTTPPRPSSPPSTCPSSTPLGPLLQISTSHPLSRLGIGKTFAPLTSNFPPSSESERPRFHVEDSEDTGLELNVHSASSCSSRSKPLWDHRVSKDFFFLETFWKYSFKLDWGEGS